MSTGTDYQGSYYPSIDAMWQSEINLKSQKSGKGGQTSNGKTKFDNPIGSINDWYSKANKYWSSAQSSYDGVLSGFGNLSSIDITGSTNFLKSYITTKAKINSKFAPNRVLDCGAGIGRIAKQMLCQIFKTVDLIDQCQKYIDKAREILKDRNVGHFYARGLQDFKFEEKYDCIWVQWVLSHLTDKDAVNFLKEAKKSLNQDGFIVVKQNHSENEFLVDKEDCSVSRSSELYKKLFQQADLKIIKEEKQKSWPQDLLDVKMYILE